MSLQDISNTLWRQRNLLDMLMFKLDEEQLLLSAGRTRWIAAATREVEQVLEEIRTTELVRSALVEEIAASLGLGHNPSLRELAEAAPEPWASLLDEHRRAFLALTEETVAVAKANKDMLARGASAAREALAYVSDEKVGAYDASGTVTTLRRQATLVNRSL